ncbi:predicted protein [Naegleria gruberi]|uniref:Predicted protein n=1 Tax=Naegleria gruberi TaxID=5762 RepID=D2V5Y3_NAEGR|nr:uncharacterized protein NAEGRDRAFT_64243 [Naegleria gruberi]EFC47879.1 predicted protein [Naegleria gruberi]|eukprot:XP_002680623.1 predicted protein [Naegleria gruberi strain NEG-M]
MALLEGVPIDNGSDDDDIQRASDGDEQSNEQDDLSGPKEVVEIRYASYDGDYWKSRVKLIGIGFLYFVILNSVVLVIGFWACPDIQIFGYEIVNEIFKWMWYMILLVMGFFYVSNVTEQRCLYRELVVVQQKNVQNEEFSVEEFGHVFWIKHFFKKLIESIRGRSFREFSKYYLQDREGTCSELINLLSPRSFKLVENRKRSKKDIFVYFPIYLVGVMSCIETSTTSTAFSYFLNNGIFVIAYYIGLQFTYLDKIEFLQLFGDRIANSNRWKEIRIFEWIGVLISAIALLVVIGLQIFTFITKSGIDILIAYALGYFFFFLFVSIVYISLSHVRKTHYLHMHHYFLFLIIIPLFRSTGYFNIGTLCSGLCLGIFIEGVSRWGMHGILIERR